MKKLSLLLLLPFISFPAFAHDYSPRERAFDETTLEISAQSEVRAAPDMATISAGVVTTSLTAQVAMQDNAKKMAAVFSAIRAAGVAEKDMQTSGISLSPQYDYSQANTQPKITGYQASNTVSIILHDLKKVGATLDALVAEGANQLTGPTFGIDDQEKVLDRARAEAVKKARKRADIYAAAAGLSVKRILAISEQANYTPVYPMLGKGAMLETAQVETPVAGGQVGLSVTVNITFELAP